MITATRSKSQLAYHWIKERIASGAYSSGYRLVLGSIASELGVSAVPVREAIRMLEAEGLVTFERNVGAQVAMVDEGEYVTTMEVLSIVEGAATALSAPHLSGDDLARARAVNAEMTETLAHFDPHRFTQLNLAFHSVLFEGCPNSQLLELVHRGWNRLAVIRDSTFSFVPGRAEESVHEHEQIVELITRGAPAAEIEGAARAHRMRTVEALLDYQSTLRHRPSFEGTP
ncbi:MAG TPA: GntR family transcriptional regulator [Pseudolysinimonas sp.]